MYAIRRKDHAICLLGWLLLFGISVAVETVELNLLVTIAQKISMPTCMPMILAFQIRQLVRTHPLAPFRGGGFSSGAGSLNRNKILS